MASAKVLHWLAGSGSRKAVAKVVETRKYKRHGWYEEAASNITFDACPKYKIWSWLINQILLATGL